MVQVITVSANTAAYAMEALKPPRRVAREHYIRDAMEAAGESTENGRAGLPPAARLTAEMSGLAIDLAAAGPSRDRLPQATLKEVHEAYRLFSEE